VELALLLPFLVFLFVIALDFARGFYFALTLNNCARNGALWACDPVNADGGTPPVSPYSSISQAALADASNLSPAPNVSSATGSDSNGDSYVEVTVTWSFSTLTNYPGIPSPITLTRTVRMMTIPVTPSFN
jgi:hypothetical protein